MDDMKRIILWTTLVLIIVLTGLSIYGAFIGAERAQVFFNSAPSALYWIVFLGTLISAGFWFKRLIKGSGLLMHAGCIAVLIGGIWGSAAGRHLQKTWFGRDLIMDGRIALRDGQTSRQVFVGEGNDVTTHELPFDLHLDSFRIEYYPGKLFVGTPDGSHTWTFDVEPNAVYDLGSTHGRLKILRTYRNFKIDISEGQRRAYDAPDAPGPGSNPAVEIEETKPGAAPTSRTVFALHPGHGGPAGQLMINYRPAGMVSDYISETKVLKDGEVVAQKAIEVNYPLYYGGYHFYQSSYGQDQFGLYTVLSVMSNTGLYWVYAGYIMLCLGVIWQLWFKRLRTNPGQEAT